MKPTYNLLKILIIHFYLVVMFNFEIQYFSVQNCNIITRVYNNITLFSSFARLIHSSIPPFFSSYCFFFLPIRISNLQRKHFTPFFYYIISSLGLSKSFFLHGFCFITVFISSFQLLKACLSLYFYCIYNTCNLE